MGTIDTIIARLGGADAAARRTGVGTEAVRKWRQARAIPTRHWAAIIEATGLSFAEMQAADRAAAEPAVAATQASPMTPLRSAAQMQDQTDPPGATPPEGATALLALADGTLFWGHGFGAHTAAGAERVGELCFCTGMTGYQETLTDPSYAGQIVTFTFPHIGNVGANVEDLEATTIAALGLVVQQDVTEPSSWRSAQALDAWLLGQGVPGIAGVDTRALTLRIRDGGPPSAVLAHPRDGRFDIAALVERARAWPGLEGMDLAKQVSCTQSYAWEQGVWTWPDGFGVGGGGAGRHVVAVDYGAKRNILRCLADAGCRVTVVPADASAEDILRHRPDGVFLSNGPGDPAATGAYAVPAIQGVLAQEVPVFGICLGHQLLALALGAKTYKLERGHRGANQPVKDLVTGRVEITSQNHGFAVDDASLPEGVVVTHRSLFDGSNEGIAAEGRRAFSVQYHPEASPGPSDSHHLFRRFVAMMDEGK
jgi:carbamoyl-phosphate synthase small subunit